MAIPMQKRAPTKTLKPKRHALAFFLILGLLAFACEESQPNDGDAGDSAGGEENAVQVQEIQIEAKQLTFSDSGAEDPSIFQGQDGYIYIAWMDRAGQNEAHLWYAKSLDGQSWSDPVQITQNMPGDHFYVTFLQAADGSFYAAWFSTRSGNFDIWLSHSNDGLNWSAMQQMTTFSGWDWAPALLQTTDGTLWLAYSSDSSGNRDIWMLYSGDGTN
ncbi:MAG: exo-alpha-sialidase [Chloroflexi bacterium]|nr:exo-alpha-sialidase [Chloroflexota bacterium]